MQSILYHNSSGMEAFAGPLKQREVHRAITLHPVKNHTHMYRLHSYIQASTNPLRRQPPTGWHSTLDISSVALRFLQMLGAINLRGISFS